MDNNLKLEIYTTLCIEHDIYSYLANVCERGKAINAICEYENDDAVLGAYYTENDVYFGIISKKKYDANEHNFFAHIVFEKDEEYQTYQWGARQLAKLIFREINK